MVGVTHRMAKIVIIFVLDFVSQWLYIKRLDLFYVLARFYKKHIAP